MNSKLSSIITGGAIGVLAVAAAPFTGGGSILAGTSLAASLAGTATIATAVGAGVIGAGIGATICDDSDDELITKTSNATDNITNPEIKKLYDFYLGLAAVSYYTARANKIITPEEQAEINYSLRLILDECIIDEEIKNEFSEIAENENLGFSDVIAYLNNLSASDISKLSKTMDKILSLDENTEKEIKSVKHMLNIYSTYRGAKEVDENLEAMIENM